MPLGFERINARHNSPNERIVFIKPLEGSNKEISLDFLSRVAAICTPIMKKHYLSVLSLEEFEPNFEFVGRNFNAGEVIQLVLRSPTTGRWLPFRYVQMVMMHELAHCKQMNHSRAFWRVRNEYADELKTLWTKNYSGDGLWGRGQTLYDGQYTSSSVPDLKDLPEHLCGGTYRSSSRKRKRKPREGKPTLSYAERKQKRIAKKFGINGMALGGDENVKVKLENGKKIKGNPRVAKSTRGRELRAAAALARLEENKSNESLQELDSHSDTEDSDAALENINSEHALDVNGNKILDSKGQGLIKICDKEDLTNDVDACQELEELGYLATPTFSKPLSYGSSEHRDTFGVVEGHQNESYRILSIQADKKRRKDASTGGKLSEGDPSLNTSWEREEPLSLSKAKVESANTETKVVKSGQMKESNIEAHDIASANFCQACSFENEQKVSICVVCSNVLDTDAVSDHWRCQSSTCRGNIYINHGDNRICSLCGGPRTS